MGEVRTAEATWHGDLVSGNGTINYVTSGAISRLPVTWASRTEAHNGKTSPEELIAAAHAACFSMAFSAQLGRNGTPPETLEVKASVTFDKVEAGWKITRSDLTVRGTVPGIDDAKFQELAAVARDGCPVSGALKGNVELSVDATLAA
jgi:osmotically inducible protein OsmC